MGKPAAGAAKVAVCVACHGEGGITPTAPIYPSLAGQSSEYLTSSLQAYRDGQRQGGMAAMMSPQAATLSDQDIADIAAYYSQQDPCVDAQSPAEKQ
jgi:cytochrome c553